MLLQQQTSNYFPNVHNRFVAARCTEWRALLSHQVFPKVANLRLLSNNKPKHTHILIRRPCPYCMVHPTHQCAGSACFLWHFQKPANASQSVHKCNPSRLQVQVSSPSFRCPLIVIRDNSWRLATACILSSAQLGLTVCSMCYNICCSTCVVTCDARSPPFHQPHLQPRILAELTPAMLVTAG
jgi:hypothetical protein